jgi:dihydroxyacetone kinase-like protein
LNAADGQLGDGDLGITVSKAWQEIAAKADALPNDVGQAFLECARIFQRVSSSSYGTLSATGFMAAAKACKGKTLVPWSDISALVAAARDAIMARGNGQLGDKTVLDGLDAIAGATSGISEPADLMSRADAACDECLDRFRSLPNKLGRARMFAEKSKGLDDPGMLALRRVLDGILGKTPT